MNNCDMSRVVRKPAFCICENKDADQLHGNHKADQRLCFRYTDSTISLLPKYKISSLQPSSVAVQPGLCPTWSETPNTGFVRTRLIFFYFCSKYRLWVHVRTASITSTHNLCFRAKLRKKVYPCKPQFYYIKVWCKGV